MKYSYSALPYQIFLRVDCLYTFYYFQFPQGFVFSGETHPFWEMVYVDGGRAEASVDGQSVTLRQGDILFHKPNEFHSIQNPYPELANVLVISFQCDSEAMNAFEGLRFACDDEQRYLLHRILVEANQTFREPLYVNKRSVNEEYPGGMQMIISHLEQFLILYTHKQRALDQRRLDAEGRSTETLETGIRIISYMRQHLDGSLHFSDLCRHSGMSESSLKRMFHSHYHTTPIAFYEMLRIQEGQHMLRTGVSLTQVAERLGFSSTAYFCARFKARVGYTPMKYLKTIRDK